MEKKIIAMKHFVTVFSLRNKKLHIFRIEIADEEISIIFKTTHKNTLTIKEKYLRLFLIFLMHAIVNAKLIMD